MSDKMIILDDLKKEFEEKKEKLKSLNTVVDSLDHQVDDADIAAV